MRVQGQVSATPRLSCCAAPRLADHDVRGMIMIEHNRGLRPRVCIMHGICSAIDVMTRFHRDKALVIIRNVDLRLTVFFVLGKAVFGRFFFIC